MKTSVYLLALASFCAVSRGHGQGTLIAGHFGDADPTSEGFTLVRGGSPSLAPVVDDLGRNAWSIGLDTYQDIGAYRRFFTPEEQAALGAGWILSITLRVLEPFGAPTLGISTGLQTGTEAFPVLRFGAQPDGDPILKVLNSEYTLEGAGSGYHNYQLRYDANAGLASLWGDGTLLATDLAGSPNPNAGLSWGGAQHGPGSAYANWNEVSLRAIPEPSPLTLLTLGSAWLLLARRQRRSDVSAAPGHAH